MQAARTTNVTMKNEQSINNFFLSDGQTALPKFTHGSLFSGIGGFDLAAEWMGWENIFHCEWNEFGQQLLKHYWPNAKSYADIKKTDFTIHRGTIEILTGGFPCQPYSQAGKRLGKEDDRHLWPEMLRAIREIQPTWIVAENVRGLTNWNGGMVFDEVQADLENEGYEVTPFLLPACAVNAPHRRDRIWFVAYSTSKRTQGFRNEHGLASETSSKGEIKQIVSTWIDANTDSIGQANEYKSDTVEGYGERLHNKELTTYSSSKRQSGQGWPEGQSNKEAKGDWKKYRVIDDGRWPTISPFCSGNDGLSYELDGITFSKWASESIKAAGNAIVPQVAFEIFKCISVLERGGKNY
jgi:DNA (cytosine-5)-methyltransferase 1